MKTKVFSPIVEGFFDSIQLTISIFTQIAIAIVNVLYSFVNHTVGSSSSNNDPSHVKTP